MSHSSHIAIVGLAAHLPGARDAKELWSNLAASRASFVRYTPEQLEAAGVASSLLRHPRYVPIAAPLDDMELFDGEFFGLSPKESAIMDPQHRHFLEVAWEAFEDAGIPPSRFEGPIGVFAGCGMGSYFYQNLLTNPELVANVGAFLLRHTGNDKDFLPTRVSYCFDLQGPAVGVQTACSTSLVAVHLACQSLLAGESDLALAGGVTIEFPHRQGYVHQPGEVLSPDGACHAFDHRGQGTVFGSGAAAVVLRRAEDAIAAGDPVYAILEGTAVNNDGAGKVGYLAPSVSQQAAAAAEALAVAELSAEAIDYVEAHGTGTAMGDPIEIAALTQAFRETTERNQYCGVGSLKTNIGHLDTAAGVASLIKVCLALRNELIPASLGYERPNPDIDFEKSPFFVVDSLRPWPRGDRTRRATVNSLGVGGTNAHVVVAEPPPAPSTLESPRAAHPLFWSARSRAALDGQMPRMARHLREQPGVPLADVGFTQLVGRHRFSRRRVLAAADREDAIRLLEDPDPRRVFDHVAEEQPSVAFLFPGGGAQYPDMAKGLFEHDPTVRTWVERGLEAFAGLKPDFDLRASWFPEPSDRPRAAELLRRPAVQLPAIYILSHALAMAWIERGVQPAALLGHSLGENTAAAVAGVLSFEEGLGLVFLRGQLMEEAPPGGMLSIPLSAEDLSEWLGPELELGVVNGPELCVATGPVEPLEDLARRLEAQGIEAKRIEIDIAAHSRLLEPAMPRFESYLEQCRLQPPRVPIVSNLTGRVLTDDEATSPTHWARQLRQTVQFSRGLETLLATEGRVLLEVGPGRSLSSLARQQPAMTPEKSAIPTLRHPDEPVSDAVFFTTAHARLWAAGLDLEPEAFWKGEARRRCSIPTYAFQRQRYFYDPLPPRRDDSTALEKLPVDAWYHAPKWAPRYVEPPDREDERLRWLVFMDDAGVGERLVERLERDGQTVLTVWPGDQFVRATPTSYRLAPEHGLLGHQDLVDDLVDRGLVPDRIIHLWSLTRDTSFRPGSSFFHRNVEQGFYSVFHLAQALVAKDVETPIHLTGVSNGMQSVQGERVLHPAKATLLGALRVIPRELPNVTCSSLDVQLPRENSGLRARRRSGDDLDALAEAVRREAVAPPSERDAAIRDGIRYELSFRPLSLDRRPARPAIRRGGTYLVTGGLGGMGLAIAEHLWHAHGARTILQSRTGLPDRDTWDDWIRQHGEDDATSRKLRVIRDLEAAGAGITVEAVDVCDVHAMRELARRARTSGGRIDGVFHAAGVARDEVLGMKQPVDVEEVFAPKIQGLRVLQDVFEDIDLLVLFSSTSAVVGLPGQIDYAAANAYLSAYAHHVDPAARPRVMAVDWGVWKDVGMGAEIARQMGRGPDAEVSREPLRHPLFLSHARTRGGALLLDGRLSPARSWLLDEHRTLRSGRALVPGSSYPEMVLAGLRAIDVLGPVEIEDLLFLDALGVGDDEERSFRVRFKEGLGEWSFEVQSRRRRGDGTEGWQTHAQGRVSRGRARPKEPLDGAALRRECPKVSEEPPPTPQPLHLDLGPRWRVLRRAARGSERALGWLSSSPELASEDRDWLFHPGLFDVATGFAIDLAPGYSPDDLWVPIEYRRLRIYDRLPARVMSWVRVVDDDPRAGTASFDATLADESGAIVAELEGLTMRRLAREAAADFGRPNDEGPLEPLHATVELGSAELAFQNQLALGIEPSEGIDALHRALERDLGPEVMITSIAPDALLRSARARRAAPTRAETFSRPELGSEYLEPRDEVEQALVDMWRELLGVDRVGVQDDFFELGGHSLVAVRLFSRIRRAFQSDFPIATLFDAPTIEQVAALVRSSRSPEEPTPGAAAVENPEDDAPGFRFLVPMHPAVPPSATPMFIVAGMFGNVMNLRYLAAHLGRDRPFYALQARGLTDGEPPHETFEEAAADYLEEIRRIQPRGPYIVGGFSGGGITAYELAQQLRTRGEEVDLLVMLDTPLPVRERITKLEAGVLHWRQLRSEGIGYLAEWSRARARWELGRVRRRLGLDREAPRADGEFRNQAVHDAFNRALERYALQPYPGRVVLLRPRLQAVHDFGGGRVASAERLVLYHDNGWRPWTANLEVYEVPGDHDAMVLEPNVRVVARHIRRLIADVLPTDVRGP